MDDVNLSPSNLGRIGPSWLWDGHTLGFRGRNAHATTTMRLAMASIHNKSTSCELLEIFRPSRKPESTRSSF